MCKCKFYGIKIKKMVLGCFLKLILRKKVLFLY